MSRSPYNTAFGRSFDGGPGGGASELETDVMRFMAILSLCLVAIFALVQSLPLRPLPETPEPAPEAARAPADTPPVAAAHEPSASSPPAVAAPAARDTAKALPAPARPVPVRSAPSARERPAAPAVATGFVLQFENDLALTRLVEQGAVGLYALSAGRTHRLAADGGRLQFLSAPLPHAVHEMDPATVPVAVRRALAAAGVTDAPARWGVTLPAPTSAELERLLETAEGGTLVIDARGLLRLEP